jgi:hypothetical protein
VLDRPADLLVVLPEHRERRQWVVHRRHFTRRTTRRRSGNQPLELCAYFRGDVQLEEGITIAYCDAGLRLIGGTMPTAR